MNIVSIIACSCLLVEMTVYSMDFVQSDIFSQADRNGSLFNQAVSVVTKRFEKKERLHLNAENVCSKYNLIYNDIFFNLPRDAGQKVKDYCCLKYGYMESPYDLEIIKPLDDHILALASNESICVLSGNKSISLIDTVASKLDTLYEIQKNDDRAFAVAISPMRVIAVGMLRGALRLWDLVNKTCYETEEIHSDTIVITH